MKKIRGRKSRETIPLKASGVLVTLEESRMYENIKNVKRSWKETMLSKHITITYGLDGRGPLHGSNYIKPRIAPLWPGNLCNVRLVTFYVDDVVSSFFPFVSQCILIEHEALQSMSERQNTWLDDEHAHLGTSLCMINVGRSNKNFAACQACVHAYHQLFIRNKISIWS